MTIKHLQNQKSENNQVKSRISDYWVFLIGMTLVILSTFSDLNQNSRTGELIPTVQENYESLSPTLEGISVLQKEDLIIKSEGIK